MKLFIEYRPKNWNEYINLERKNLYAAAKVKRDEKEFVLWTAKEKYEGEYPVELIIKPRFNSKRQDLDNYRYKGILDGLVSAGVLRNDNLTCIRRITLEAVFDKEKEGVEIEIKPIEKDAN